MAKGSPGYSHCFDVDLRFVGSAMVATQTHWLSCLGQLFLRHFSSVIKEWNFRV